MRVAILLLLLALGVQLDAARVRRDDEVYTGPYASNSECRCEERFHCFCVLDNQCHVNGSMNYYRAGVLPARDIGVVETCPGEERCCTDILGPEKPAHVTPSRPRPLCGIRGPDSPGGATGTQHGEFPWTLAIYWLNGSEWAFQCGASLVGKNLALTAAHCIKKFQANPSALRVRAGIWNLDGDTEYQEMDVIGIEPHPDYSSGPLWNDIALILTKQNFKKRPSVGSVCLPPQGFSFPPGTKCIVTGWGQDVFGPKGKLRSKMRQVEVPLVPNDECQKRLRRTYLGKFFLLHESFTCAGGESKADTCQGDGGGPLVCQAEGQYFQAGIVSWGIGCGVRRLPGVYVDVSHYSDWIMKTYQRLS